MRFYWFDRFSAASGKSVAARACSAVPALLVVLLLSSVGHANAGVLYDQVDPTSPESTTSQDFEAMFDSFDGMVADDFTVPAGRTWRLESVLFRGIAEIPTALPSGMRVSIFANSAGAPGTQLSTAVATISAGTYPRPVANLGGSMPILAPGTYWLGGQAVLNASTFTGPQWFWADSDAGPFGNAAHFRNPGDGFESTCAAFKIRSTCLFPDSFHPSHDQSFSLSGANFSITPDTTITSGPAEGSSSASTSASFAFSSTEPEASFQCSTDAAAFSACTSPVNLTSLAIGNHSFSVRVGNGLGTVDPTPATRNFSVTSRPVPSQACLSARTAVTKARAALKKAKSKLANAKSKVRKEAAKKAVARAKQSLNKANSKVRQVC